MVVAPREWHSVEGMGTTRALRDQRAWACGGINDPQNALGINHEPAEVTGLAGSYIGLRRILAQSDYPEDGLLPINPAYNFAEHFIPFAPDARKKKAKQRRVVESPPSACMHGNRIAGWLVATVCLLPYVPEVPAELVMDTAGRGVDFAIQRLLCLLHELPNE